jgi:hypothetical protein
MLLPERKRALIDFPLKALSTPENAPQTTSDQLPIDDGLPCAAIASR